MTSASGAASSRTPKLTSTGASGPSQALAGARELAYGSFIARLPCWLRSRLGRCVTGSRRSASIDAPLRDVANGHVREAELLAEGELTSARPGEVLVRARGAMFLA